MTAIKVMNIIIPIVLIISIASLAFLIISIIKQKRITRAVSIFIAIALAFFALNIWQYNMLNLQKEADSHSTENREFSEDEFVENVISQNLKIGGEAEIIAGKLYENISEVCSNISITAIRLTEDCYALEIAMGYTAKISDIASAEVAFADFIDDYRAVFDVPEYMNDVFTTVVTFSLNGKEICTVSSSKTMIGDAFFQPLEKASVVRDDELDEKWTSILNEFFGEE